MRKSSPRLLAGIVVLGLFAVVGTLTFTAFTKNVREVSAPQSSIESREGVKTSIWDETRSGSSKGS